MQVSNAGGKLLGASDDLRHDIGQHPLARENLSWTIALPDEELSATVFVSMPLNADPTVTVMVMRSASQPDLVETIQRQPFRGDDLDDFAIGDLIVRQPEPLASAEVTYSGDRVKLEYRFDAIHDAWDDHRNRDGCAPPGGHNRFEQSGLINGRLEVDGRVLDLATAGHRGHLWGPRDLGSILHYKWIAGQSGSDASFNARVTWWRGQQFINGYVFRNGALSGITDFRWSIQCDDQLVQSALMLELTDELERSTVVRSDGPFATQVLELPNLLNLQAAYRMEIADHVGAGVMDQGYPAGYREHLQAADMTGIR